MYRLTPAQVEELGALQGRLHAELDADVAPWTDDALALRDLDSWIDAALDRGRIRPEAMRDLWNQGQRLPRDTRARGYFENAHALVTEADVRTSRRAVGSGPLRARLVEVVALFVAWFLLFLGVQRYGFHHPWRDSVETALVMAAIWAVMHVVVEGLRTRRSRRQA